LLEIEGQQGAYEVQRLKIVATLKTNTTKSFTVSNVTINIQHTVKNHFYVKRSQWYGFLKFDSNAQTRICKFLKTFPSPHPSHLDRQRKKVPQVGYLSVSALVAIIMQELRNGHLVPQQESAWEQFRAFLISKAMLNPFNSYRPPIRREALVRARLSELIEPLGYDPLVPMKVIIPERTFRVMDCWCQKLFLDIEIDEAAHEHYSEGYQAIREAEIRTVYPSVTFIYIKIDEIKDLENHLTDLVSKFFLPLADEESDISGVSVLEDSESNDDS